jgi:hypothetical protein
MLSLPPAVLPALPVQTDTLYQLAQVVQVAFFAIKLSLRHQGGPAGRVARPASGPALLSPPRSGPAADRATHHEEAASRRGLRAPAPPTAAIAVVLADKPAGRGGGHDALSGRLTGDPGGWAPYPRRRDSRAREAT